MKNEAFNDKPCGDCGTTILKGDPIFFTDEGVIVCEGCGTSAGNRCDGCGGQKKSRYRTCFECKDTAQATERHQVGRGRR